MASFKRQGPGIKNLEKTLKNINGLTTKVGWFPGAKYQDGTPVAYVATIQEYGSPMNGIPPRSFMRTTIAEKENEWAKLARSGAKAIIAGNASPIMVMEGLGLAASGDIRKKISEINSPALKAETIAARKRKLSKGKKVGALTKPLVETSLMVSSLTSTVESR